MVRWTLDSKRAVIVTAVAAVEIRVLVRVTGTRTGNTVGALVADY